MTDIKGKTTIVVGASRGLGLGIATALAEAGARVIAASRSTPAVMACGIETEIVDAADATAPARLLDRHDPDIVVLVAGAVPHMRPLQQQTWETFSVNWQSDVRIAFHWLREILLKPLKPASRVVVFSSGAALGGSPLSGGYAGAKAAQRFITNYAQDEARRAGLDITFTAIAPRFAPETSVGRSAVQAYATRAGQSVETFLAGIRQAQEALLTPAIAGTEVTRLVMEEREQVAPAYLLTGMGLQKLP